MTEITRPDTRIGFLLYRAGVLVGEAYADRVRPLGLAPAEIGILTQLATGGDAHVRGLARALGVSPQTVVNLTLKLEARGLVTRDAVPADQRAVGIALTPDGRAALARAEAVARDFDARIGAQLGPATPAVIRALRALIEEGVT